MQRELGAYRALAPGKVNLGLFVGPVRASDSRHELVSVMQSISLADQLTLQAAPVGVEGDEVLCPGVPGPAYDNLASAALRAFRAATGWAAPPLSLHIEKRIPVAAGLAGGSADAAATLRLARHASGLGDDRLLLELAATLGADVPAQTAPGRWLARGAGERLRELPAPGSFGLLLLPSTAGLSTAAVFAEADRLELARQERELDALEERLVAELADGAALPADATLLHNDLQGAAVTLRPELADRLAEVLELGASVAMVSGSGPTVVGLFAGERGGVEAARLAAQKLHGRVPVAIVAEPVGGQFGTPWS